MPGGAEAADLRFRRRGVLALPRLGRALVTQAPLGSPLSLLAIGAHPYEIPEWDGGVSRPLMYFSADPSGCGSRSNVCTNVSPRSTVGVGHGCASLLGG
jgi:hypothetical protein